MHTFSSKASVNNIEFIFTNTCYLQTTILTLATNISIQMNTSLIYVL